MRARGSSPVVAALAIPLAGCAWSGKPKAGGHSRATATRGAGAGSRAALDPANARGSSPASAPGPGAVGHRGARGTGPAGAGEPARRRRRAPRANAPQPPRPSRHSPLPSRAAAPAHSGDPAGRCAEAAPGFRAEAPGGRAPCWRRRNGRLLSAGQRRKVGGDRSVSETIRGGGTARRYALGGPTRGTRVQFSPRSCRVANNEFEQREADRRLRAGGAQAGRSAGFLRPESALPFRLHGKQRAAAGDGGASRSCSPIRATPSRRARNPPARCGSPRAAGGRPGGGHRPAAA